MSEVKRINNFYETKQIELIQEFKDLQGKYIRKI